MRLLDRSRNRLWYSGYMACGMWDGGLKRKTFVALLLIFTHARTYTHLLFLCKSHYRSLSSLSLSLSLSFCFSLAYAPSRSVSLNGHYICCCGMKCCGAAIILSAHHQRPVGRQLQYQRSPRQSRNATHEMRGNLSCQLRIQTIWK